MSEDDHCHECGHGHEHGPGARHYTMVDMEVFGHNWQMAAEAQRAGDIDKVSELMLPRLSTYVNFGYGCVMAMVGAVLTATEMRTRAGVPDGAHVQLVAEQRDPSMEPTAFERVAISMIMAAGSGDFPTMHHTLKVFCPKTGDGIANLVDVQAEIMSIYQMVIECH